MIKSLQTIAHNIYNQGNIVYFNPNSDKDT